MNFKKDKLITERLILRKLKLEDAEPMFLNWYEINKE
jgi:RimJ/RimL family protein N-acetyltransferase